MRLVTVLSLAGLVLAPLAAQATHSVVFTGRFGFVSLDAPNERMGGSLTQLREFDLSVVTPGQNAVARSWVPTTAHSAMWGDGHRDGNHARFYQWKLSYGERFNFAGPFLKYADRNAHDPRLLYWTIRDDAVGKRFEVFTNNGTQTVQIGRGDFFRWGRNGNVEYFITQALIDKARGKDRLNRAESPGAGCIVQDQNRNLYYSPSEGGHWVHGNYGVSQPLFAYDGDIVMIDAADITYDSNGNVQDVNPDVAHSIFPEIGAGPNGQPSIRTIVTNAGAVNFDGGSITTTTKMVGLSLDPNGGTISASLPYGTGQVYPVVPNFVFAWDSGNHGATIFSTRLNPTTNAVGSIAVINGVKCGSDLATSPVTGAHLGVQLDKPNFQPTVMGIAVVPVVPYTPFTADAPNDGAILAADPGIFLDVQAGPNQPVFAILAPGPVGTGTFAPSIDLGAQVGIEGFRSLYAGATGGGISFLPLGITNASGYVTLSFPNIHASIPTGTTVLWQAFKIGTGTLGLALSNPVLQQFK